MVRFSRIGCWLLLCLLVAGSVVAQDTLSVGSIGDTALLPFGSSYNVESNFGVSRKAIRHSIRMLHPGRRHGDTSLCVQVENSPLNQDEAASVFIKRLPGNIALTQEPFFLTVTDFCLYRDSSTHQTGVAIVGYRGDSAFLVRNIPGVRKFDWLYLASGKDMTGNGAWEPTPLHITSVDYDYDGSTELFFYLACGRDRLPRLFFCIDIERLEIEWSLPMASSALEDNIASCFDSLDPGVLVCSYGPENHVSDSVFDDRFGYFTRIDRNGKIVFNYRLAPKFGGPGIRALPGDSLYVLFHEWPLPGQSGDSTTARLSIIDNQGRPRHSIEIETGIGSLSIADVRDDSIPEILFFGRNGALRIFDLSLSNAAIAPASGLESYLSTFCLPGSGEVAMQFGASGKSVLYNREWDCLGVIPDLSHAIMPAAYDSLGGVTMFVANQENGYVIGDLFQRPWSERVVRLLWRFRVWFVVALILISIQLVIVHIRRRRAIDALAGMKARNEAMLSASPDLMFRISDEGVFLDYQANRQAELFASADQFLGKSATEILPPALARQLMDSIELTLRSGVIQSFEYQLSIGNRREDYEARMVMSGKSEVLAIVRNISDRKAREAAIRRQAQILESVQHSIVVTDLEGIITEWNAGSEEIAGYTAAEAIGRPIQFLYSPEDWARAQPMMSDSIDREGKWDGEVTILTKSGEKRYCQLTVSPVRDEHGQRLGSVGYAVDITERRYAEWALRESETNFRTFFETIDDLLIVATKEGRIQFTNTALQTKLGYAAEELAAMHLLDLHPPDRRDEAKEIFDAMLRGERSSCPVGLMKKDGTLVPVETRVWFGQWNGSECTFGLCKDLSAEQEAEQRFQRLFQANPALMALSEMTEGRFIDVNEAFLRTIGFTRQEVIGKTARDLSIFVDPQIQAIAVQQLYQDRRLSEYELRVRCKDGAILNGLFSGEIIRSQGTEYALSVMIDITKRKLAEEALRQSREFLLTVIDTIPTRVFWKDRQGYYLGCNTQFAQDAGFKDPQEVIGKNDNSMVWREQAELYRADDRAVIESGRAKMMIEEPQTTPSGEVIQLLTSKVPLRDSDGVVVGVLGAYQDISTRKRAEQALRESEEKYRGLTEHANIGILQYDEDRIYYANQQIAETLETTTDHLVQITTSQLIESLTGPASISHFMKQIRNRLHGLEAPPRFETDITTFKGNPKRLEAIAVRIELGGKAIIQATWLDITARYQAAQDLRDSEAKFRAVAESMTAGITIFSANKLLYCNPASSRITGYSHEELLAMNFWEMIHPSFRELVLQRGRDRIAGAETPPRYEVKIIRKDGGERWIDYSAQVIQFMGAACVLGTTIDITDRVTAEEALQRVYQERYQQVREIAGGVSHEIYNSLFPATTSLYKLRERLLDRPDQAEQIERDLKLIGLADQAIARAIHMTESVTHYSRLEANRKIEHVPLREVIGEIIEHNRARFESQGVKFESSVSEDAIVACGRLHLYSLLNNLVVNALDALLETQQPAIAMTVHVGPEQVVIQVSDNGPGIEPENLSKIFNAFFSTKPRSGTGLGLAMVRKIAEMYGGTIKVSSTPHKKTTFDVVLPRPTPEAGESDATP